MTFSDKALGNGWHDQAARLVGMHGMLGSKGKGAGRDDDAVAREAALSHELDHASAQIARLERRLEQEAIETTTLRQHMQLLDKQFEDADRRAEALESELATAHESAALHDNECQSLRVSLDLAIEQNTQLTQRLEQSDATLDSVLAELAQLEQADDRRSLQASLDLAIAENAQLAQSLEASEAALGTASTEIARSRTTLTETSNERSKLASELFETNAKRLSDTAELREQVEAMTVRAETAERLLTDVRECLLTRTAEGKVAERSLAEMTAARRDADGQIKQLQDLLCVKQCQLSEVEQSRNKLQQSHDDLTRSRDELKQSRDELAQSRDELVSATNALLKTCRNRDAALAQADEKIDALTKRIAQLEADARQAEVRQAAAYQASRRKVQAKAKLPAAPLLPPSVSRTPADDTDDKNRIRWAELAIELAKLVKLKGQPPEPLETGSTDALLASTITFLAA